MNTLKIYSTLKIAFHVSCTLHFLLVQIKKHFIMVAETPELFWDEEVSQSFYAFLVGIFPTLYEPFSEYGATLAKLSFNSRFSKACTTFLRIISMF